MLGAPESWAFKAEAIEVEDYESAVELFYERNWTDGLAVVPPTPHKVQAMIDYVGRDPSEELGTVPPRHGVVTVEKLAISAVMAGCKCEYFPILLAAFDAMIDSRHNLNGVQTTTHCCVPLLIVSGPIVQQLQINAGWGCFGSGYRANGSLGRAIRLILWNAGGSYPWTVDRSTMAHPGKWTFCIGENTDESPWPSLGTDHGFPEGSNTVTMFSCEAPHSIMTYGTPAEMLLPICRSMATLGTNNSFTCGQSLLVLNPWVARQLDHSGMSKDAVKAYVYEHARVSKKAAQSMGVMHHDAHRKYWPKHIVDSQLDDEPLPIVDGPEHIHIVVAGGERYFSACCPGWGKPGGYAVTREIVLPK